MSDRQAASRAYLRFVMQKRELTPSGLAKLSNVSASTLTRILNKKDHKFTISMSTLDKISQATGEDYVPFLEAKDISQASTLRTKSTLQGKFWEDALAGLIPVIASVSADIWHDISEPDFGANIFYVPIQIARKELKDQFIVAVKGNSCNELAVDGEFLLCEQLGGNEQSQCFMVIERYNEGRTRVELTAQLVSFEDDTLVLRLPSADPNYANRETRVTRGDTSDVRPIGLVRFVFRRLPLHVKPQLIVH